MATKSRCSRVNSIGGEGVHQTLTEPRLRKVLLYRSSQRMNKCETSCGLAAQVLHSQEIGSHDASAEVIAKLLVHGADKDIDIENAVHKALLAHFFT